MDLIYDPAEVYDADFFNDDDYIDDNKSDKEDRKSNGIDSGSTAVQDVSDNKLSSKNAAENSMVDNVDTDDDSTVPVEEAADENKERFIRTEGEKKKVSVMQRLSPSIDISLNGDSARCSKSDDSRIIVLNLPVSYTLDQLKEFINSKLDSRITLEKVDGIYACAAMVWITPVSAIEEVASSLQDCLLEDRKVVARKMSPLDYDIIARKMISQARGARGPMKRSPDPSCAAPKEASKQAPKPTSRPPHYRLTITGVSVEVSATELEEIFSSEVSSPVSAHLAPMEGASHAGTGYLEFQKEEAARTAHTLLNGTDIEGSSITLTLDINKGSEPEEQEVVEGNSSGDMDISDHEPEQGVEEKRRDPDRERRRPRENDRSRSPLRSGRGAEDRLFDGVIMYPNLEDLHRRSRGASCRAYVANIPFFMTGEEMVSLMNKNVSGLEGLFYLKDNEGKSKDVMIMEFKSPAAVDCFIEKMASFHIGKRKLFAKRDDRTDLGRGRLNSPQHSQYDWSGKHGMPPIRPHQMAHNPHMGPDHMIRPPMHPSRMGGMNQMVPGMDNRMNPAIGLAGNKQMEGPPFSPGQQMGGPPFGPGQQMNGPSFGPGQQMNRPPFGPGQQMDGPPFGPGQQMDGPPFGPGQQMDGPPFGPGQQMDGPPFGPGQQVATGFGMNRPLGGVSSRLGEVMMPQPSPMDPSSSFMPSQQLPQQPPVVVVPETKLVVYSSTTGDSNTETYGLSMAFLSFHNIKLPLVKELLVINLDSAATNADIKDLFTIAGTVTKIQYNQVKGQAIVEMAHPVQAVEAVSLLHNQEYFDKVLVVRMLRPNDTDNLVTRAIVPAVPRGLKTIGKGLGIEGLPLSTVLQLPVVPPPQQSVIPDLCMQRPPPSIQSSGDKPLFPFPPPPLLPQQNNPPPRSCQTAGSNKQGTGGREDNKHLSLGAKEWAKTQTVDIRCRLGAKKQTEDISCRLGVKEQTEDVSRRLGVKEQTEDVSRRLGVKEQTEDVSRRLGVKEQTEDVSCRLGAKRLSEDISRRLGAQEQAEDISRRAKEQAEDISSRLGAKEQAEEISHSLTKKQAEEISRRLKAKELADDILRRHFIKKQAEDVICTLGVKEQAEDVIRRLRAKEQAEEVSRRLRAKEQTEDFIRRHGAKRRAEEVSRRLRAEEQAEDISHSVTKEKSEDISCRLEAKEQVEDISLSLIKKQAEEVYRRLSANLTKKQAEDVSRRLSANLTKKQAEDVSRRLSANLTKKQAEDVSLKLRTKMQTEQTTTSDAWDTRRDSGGMDRDSQDDSNSSNNRFSDYVEDKRYGQSSIDRVTDSRHYGSVDTNRNGRPRVRNDTVEGEMNEGFGGGGRKDDQFEKRNNSWQNDRTDFEKSSYGNQSDSGRFSNNVSSNSERNLGRASRDGSSWHGAGRSGTVKLPNSYGTDELSRNYSSDNQNHNHSYNNRSGYANSGGDSLNASESMFSDASTIMATHGSGRRMSSRLGGYVPVPRIGGFGSEALATGATSSSLTDVSSSTIGREVVLFNLPSNAKELTIVDMCLPYGGVRKVTLNSTQRSCRVVFDSYQQAAMAADILNNQNYNGAVLSAMLA